MLLQVYVLRIVKIREFRTPERKLISEVIFLCKLILVNPATSASAERSVFHFPKIENIVSLNNDTRAIYQLDKHTRSLVDLANEFSDRNDIRRV